MKLGAFPKVIQLIGYVTGVRLGPTFLIPVAQGWPLFPCLERNKAPSRSFSLWKRDTLGLVVKMAHWSCWLVTHMTSPLPDGLHLLLRTFLSPTHPRVGSQWRDNFVSTQDLMIRRQQGRRVR